MAWKPRKKQWDWRAHLTADELAFIRASDRALVDLEKQHEAYRKTYMRKRQMIVNRAIQRAKYGCTPRPLPDPQESA